jgi:outer membrane biogenesis lipoprotein LolB
MIIVRRPQRRPRAVQNCAEVEKEFRRMLRLIEEWPIPLAALWVFDLPSQNADYNITADNERSYQLREVAEANARVQSRKKHHYEK